MNRFVKDSIKKIQSKYRKIHRKARDLGLSLPIALLIFLTFFSIITVAVIQTRRDTTLTRASGVCGTETPACVYGSYMEPAGAEQICPGAWRKCRVSSTCKYECLDQNGAGGGNEGTGGTYNYPNCSGYNTAVKSTCEKEFGNGNCTKCTNDGKSVRWHQGSGNDKDQVAGSCASNYVSTRIQDGQTICSDDKTRTVSCNNGTVTSKKCSTDQTCSNGQCGKTTHNCTSSYVSGSILDGNTICSTDGTRTVSCNGGTVTTLLCPNNQTCANGQCSIGAIPGRSCNSSFVNGSIADDQTVCSTDGTRTVSCNDGTAMSIKCPTDQSCFNGVCSILQLENNGQCGMGTWIDANGNSHSEQKVPCTTSQCGGNGECAANMVKATAGGSSCCFQSRIGQCITSSACTTQRFVYPQTTVLQQTITSPVVTVEGETINCNQLTCIVL